MPFFGLLMMAWLAAPALGADDAPVPVAEEADLDHLRALGYIDFADTAAPAELSGVVAYVAGRSQPGFSLYASRPLMRAELLAPSGEVIQHWQGSGTGHWSRVRLLPGGDLLVVGSDRKREKGRRVADEQRFLERRTWDDRVLWRRAVGAHHDVTVTPDGRIAALFSEERRIAAVDAEAWIRDEGVAFFTEDGDPLGSTLFYDLLASRPDRFTFRPVRKRSLDGRTLIDLLHVNSLHWLDWPELAARGPLYQPGLLLFCMRNQDAIAVVDLARGELVWSWGQGEIRGPHDASWLPNGHILLFDNRLGEDWSRAIELDPLARKIVWEWKAEPPTAFYTRSRGSVQRLANGNTLLGESDRGHALEITRSGEVVWDWWNPNRDAEGRPATIIRMERYAPDFVARILRAAKAPENPSQR